MATLYPFVERDTEGEVRFLEDAPEDSGVGSAAVHLFERVLTGEADLAAGVGKSDLAKVAFDGSARAAPAICAEAPVVYEALVGHEATGSGIAELAGAAAQVQTLQKAVFLRKSCEGLNGDCLGVEISVEPEPSLEPPSVVCNMAGGPFSADACLNFFDAAACEDFRISEKPGVLPGRDPHERAADGAADPESGSSCVVAACLLQQLLSADLPRPPEQAQVEEPRIVEAPALARLRTLGGGDSGAAVITQPATQALRNQALRRVLLPVSQVPATSSSCGPWTPPTSRLRSSP